MSAYTRKQKVAELQDELAFMREARDVMIRVNAELLERIEQLEIQCLKTKMANCELADHLVKKEAE
jgi:hypothetical protein